LVGCFTIDEDWLPNYAPYMCMLGKPSEEPSPCLKEGKVYCHRSCTFGRIQGFFKPLRAVVPNFVIHIIIL